MARGATVRSCMTVTQSSLGGFLIGYTRSVRAHDALAEPGRILT